MNFAIEVQRAMVERNAGVAPDKRIEFRIGIHLGDVVEESDGDLMGDGVNIAARLQGVAKPGGICISDDAYRQVKGRLDLKVSDLGPVPLKNIAEPMRAYSLEVARRVRPDRRRQPIRRRSAPKRRSSFASLAAAIAALLLLAVAGGWYILNGRAPKPVEAAHLSIVVLPVRQSLRRSVAGLFRRRHHRESDHRPLSLATASSSPATPPSPTKARMSTPRRSARSLAFATS